MYFGGSSFAAAPFGSSGGISIRAAVTGSRVNLSSGSPVIIGKALSCSYRKQNKCNNW